MIIKELAISMGSIRIGQPVLVMAVNPLVPGVH